MANVRKVCYVLFIGPAITNTKHRQLMSMAQCNIVLTPNNRIVRYNSIALDT